MFISFQISKQEPILLHKNYDLHVYQFSLFRERPFNTGGGWENLWGCGNCFGPRVEFLSDPETGWIFFEHTKGGLYFS